MGLKLIWPSESLMLSSRVSAHGRDPWADGWMITRTYFYGVLALFSIGKLFEIASWEWVMCSHCSNHAEQTEPSFSP